MDRRTFLATSVAGVTALAGCQTAVGSVALPEVPTEALESGGFTKQDSTKDRTVFEEDFGPVTVEAVASSVTYEDAELAARVAEDTLGAVDAPLSLFSATRIDMAPSVDELGPVQTQVETRIMEHARQQLRSQLETAGAESVERSETGTLEIRSGTTADLTELTATYPVDDLTFPIRGDRSITIEGADLGVDALLAVWSAEGNYLVAGGAYPAENFARTTDTELSDAIEVTVDVDLGLTPEAYREELLELVGGVR